MDNISAREEMETTSALFAGASLIHSTQLAIHGFPWLEYVSLCYQVYNILFFTGKNKGRKTGTFTLHDVYREETMHKALENPRKCFTLHDFCNSIMLASRNERAVV